MKKVTLEPLADEHRKDLDQYGCDETYTCIDQEELYFRGTATSKIQTYIEIELLQCNLDDETIRLEAIELAAIEARK